jgi:hypothetical protein
LAATLNVTVPLPDPLAPPVTTIQVALLEADHAHPLVVVTVNEPLPPLAGTVWDTGEIEYAHGAGAAACVTVKVCPATVIVPVRSVVVELAATLNVMVPLPDPLAVPVIVIQAALLVAVHAHPAKVAIVNDPEAPAAATD